MLAGTFTNANFSEAVFDGVVINPNNASSFYGANFSGAVFSEDIWNGEGATYYTSTFSNLVAGLVSNNCTLTHAVIPGFPDGYNGDPVYDFTNQASNFNAEVTTLEEDIIALEALVLSYSNQVESFSDVAAAESSRNIRLIIADLDDDVENLTGTTAGQSNWISTTVVNWNSILDDISEDVTTLDGQVSSLRQYITETINDLVRSLS